MPPTAAETSTDDKKKRAPRLLTWDVLTGFLSEATNGKGMVNHAELGKAVEELISKKPAPGSAAKALPVISEKTLNAIAPSIVEAYQRKEDKHTLGEGEEKRIIHGVRKSVLLDWLQTKAEIQDEEFNRDEVTAVLNSISKQTGRGLGVIVSLSDGVQKTHAPKGKRR